MGMCAFFAPVSAEQIADFKEDPDELQNFLYPEDLDEEPAGQVDVEKAWHAIHFLLNGAAEPREGDVAPVIFGGEPIGEAMDFGPARVFYPEQVKQLAAVLAGVGEAELRARYVPAQLTAADVYPGIWDRGDDEDLEYVINYYHTLVQFYTDAAARGDGAVLYIA